MRVDRLVGAPILRGSRHSRSKKPRPICQPGSLAAAAKSDIFVIRMPTWELMKPAEANAIISAVSSWAMKRSDIRAMALVGSWARGDQNQESDIDLLLLSDCAHEYRDSQEWLTEINFRDSGYRVKSSASANYGVVWSRHIHLLPPAEVELTFAECCWAQTEPVDSGTRSVVKDAFEIIFDKDSMLLKLVAAVRPG